MEDKKPKKIKNKQVEELEQKLQDLEDQLKRAVADFRNLQRRTEEEKRQTIQFANREFLMRLLPAFDTLFLAEKHVQDEGLKLSIKKLLDVFSEEGVQRIETEGKEFDPEHMECVMVEEGEENKVLAELCPGFMLHGKVIRPVQVKVGKKVSSN